MWLFHIHTDKDLAYSLCEHLDQRLVELDCDHYHDLIVTLFEAPEDQTRWCLQGVTAHDPNLDMITKEIERLKASFLPEDGRDSTYELTKEALPDRDWVAENQKQFSPLDIAEFYVYGSHIENPQPKGKIPLKIDASTAFGTGSHGTTHGCLEAFQYLKDHGVHPQNSLDIGTGTGILAMGLAKLFSTTVLATDIDDEAVEKAIYNVGLNNLVDNMTVIQADGVDHQDIQSRAPFDMIVANILADPLKDMAAGIRTLMTGGGYLVLSGILDYQADGVKDAYEQTGLSLYRETYISEWATLIFKG